jgi:hypothetical protein
MHHYADPCSGQGRVVGVSGLWMELCEECGSTSLTHSHNRIPQMVPLVEFNRLRAKHELPPISEKVRVEFVHFPKGE